MLHIKSIICPHTCIDFSNKKTCKHHPNDCAFSFHSIILEYGQAYSPLIKTHVLNQSGITVYFLNWIRYLPNDKHISLKSMCAVRTISRRPPVVSVTCVLVCQTVLTNHNFQIVFHAIRFRRKNRINTKNTVDIRYEQSWKIEEIKSINTYMLFHKTQL